MSRRAVVGAGLAVAAIACGPLPRRGARISVPARHVLADEVVPIRLSGLPPRRRVTLRATAIQWQSSATFESDKAGRVDVGKQAALEGTYQGVDPMGWLWSMERPQGGATAADEVHLSALIDGEIVATALLSRTSRADDVAVGSGSLAVVDVADPTRPTQVATVPVRASESAVTCGRVYVASGEAGLYVFDDGAVPVPTPAPGMRRTLVPLAVQRGPVEPC